MFQSRVVEKMDRARWDNELDLGAGLDMSINVSDDSQWGNSNIRFRLEQRTFFGESMLAWK